MEFRLDGKNAVVCGASKGIGRAIAVALADAGASVTALARDTDRLKKLVASLPKTSGQNHSYIAQDVLDLGALEKQIADLCGKRKTHILVNNSGGPSPGNLLEAEEGALADALQQHLLANHRLVQLLHPGMKEEGYGRVINIISVSVKEPVPGLGVSNTTRGAVASWAKTLSFELAASGTTINNILPGFTRTERLSELIGEWADQKGVTKEVFEAQLASQVPLGRFAEPEEVAAVALFLASPAASYVNGESIRVDGGKLRSI